MASQSNKLEGKRTHMAMIHLSQDQRHFLSSVGEKTGLSATKLVLRGIKKLGSQAVTDPPTSGPFSVLFSLCMDTKSLADADRLAEAAGCSRAEIIRRIIVRGQRLWEQEQSVTRPFSDVFFSGEAQP